MRQTLATRPFVERLYKEDQRAMANDRLDLPFTGIATFAKVPFHSDLATLEADVAIIGAPYDLGTQVRSGARYGPRGIRNASAIYGMRSVRYYDSEFDEVF